MNNPLLQLLVLAGIAIFLILRLRNVLGTRDGYEPPQVETPESPRPRFDVIEGSVDEDDHDILDHAPAGSPTAQALAAMKAVEPSFGVMDFLNGAKSAYEMILLAFERGDLSEVRGFLAPAVAEAFDGVIADRKARGLTTEAQFLGTRETALAAAEFNPQTRLAELFITQDIRRKVHGEHEVVIVFDPKGDADLLKRMYVEARRAGREGEMYVFHLGWPDISARYNAVGRFGRISEVATRIAGQLSGEGNSAAFREFAWRFVNIIARALVELGQRPDYLLIQRHVINIDALFIEYAQHYFAKNEPKAWEVIVQLEAKLNDKNIPRNMIGREKRVVALEQYLSQVRIYDPVLDGLRSAVRYDRTYFDKIVASLLPLLEKLTTGKIAQLLAPNYSDLSDPRPIFDWMQVIRKRAVVYVGLDALSDAEVAAAVGNSMFSDLVSVAGHIYKFGIDDGLPGAAAGTKIPINVHADEFNELMGDEFIPMVNKGGGAGVQVTAYTQTLSDIEARIGNRAKAGQVIGNFNNLFMLRVRETATAELLTRQLPKVEVYATALMSGATDSSDPHGNTAFTSNTQDRISTTSVPLIEPAHVVALPKGQCFALTEGGNLWKVRMPLPAPDPDEAMPKDLQELAGYMRQHYVEAGDWWENQGIPGLQDKALPDDLLDDFKQMAAAEEAEA